MAGGTDDGAEERKRMTRPAIEGCVGRDQISANRKKWFHSGGTAGSFLVLCKICSPQGKPSMFFVCFLPKIIYTKFFELSLCF